MQNWGSDSEEGCCLDASKGTPSLGKQKKSWRRPPAITVRALGHGNKRNH
jgi:hypothetical protein